MRRTISIHGSTKTAAAGIPALDASMHINERSFGNIFRRIFVSVRLRSGSGKGCIPQSPLADFFHHDTLFQVHFIFNPDTVDQLLVQTLFVITPFVYVFPYNKDTYTDQNVQVKWNVHWIQSGSAAVQTRKTGRLHRSL